MTRRWQPNGTHTRYGLPEVGSLVAVDHAVYRVREIRPKLRDLWGEEGHAWVGRYGDRGIPVNVIVRPAHLTGDDPTLRIHDVHLRACAAMQWDVYPDEHYPMCGKCGEPTPCRESEATREAARQAKRMARYEVAGICPACQEPVTAKQKSRTFDENYYAPLGPPVTFHASRRECLSGLIEYEDAWVIADPTRKRQYRCDGIIIVHTEDTYECGQGSDCPGPQASHKARVACSCDWHPRNSLRLTKDALNVALESTGSDS